jgi:hypothetical protein
MKILIVGGCFTCQHNISFERLYHQTIKNNFINRGDLEIEIKTITYNRLSKVLDKIEKVKADYSFDLLIFHLRAEPLLGMIKVYFKYIEENGNLRRFLNVPFHRLRVEQKHYDHVGVGSARLLKNQNTMLHRYMRELNYCIGSAIGNKKRAIKNYENCVLGVSRFCEDNQVRLLLLGPVSRPVSKNENRLSHDISNAFKSVANREQLHYLELLGERTTGNKPMFFDNGFNVSVEGHDEVADKIFTYLQSLKLANKIN